MADKDRHENFDLSLLADLQQEPYKYGFFEALRQLECLYGSKARLGESLLPGEDHVRLGQTPSLQFAPSTLTAFEKKANERAKLSVYFFGLFGPNGPLPLHLTEFTRNRIRNAKDSAFLDFTNIFHHRLLSLFYRAWANKEPTVQMDRPEYDRFALYVGSLCGLGEKSLHHRDAMPEHSKLHFSAHLGCHTKHVEGLRSIVSDYLQIPVSIQEFIGEWLDIPEDSYCYLNQNTIGQLGQSAVIGTRSWQCQNKFRITLGPTGIQEFLKLLPDKSNLFTLVDIIKNYAGLEFTWDLNLILNKNEVPPARLGEHTRLGWSSWLDSASRTMDANDLYLYRENIA